MATVPTLTVGGTDQTAFVQHKTLYWRLKSLDFTLVDPADDPVLHDAVSVDVPNWHGRVSTIESHPFRSANGTNHRLVMVTCTNKHVAVSATSPFDLSDTPNLTTTFPYKDIVYIQTLADQTDLSTAEHRLTATVYQPGLLPGQTVEVTSVAESLSATDFIITEMQTIWLMDDSPEYRIEASIEGVPPVTLGGLIGGSDCDCGPFNPDDCVDPGVEGLSCTGRDSLSHSYTEGGNIVPLPLLACVGGFEAYSTDILQYWATGGYENEFPESGIHYACSEGGLCQFLFEDGGVHYTPGGSAVFHRVVLVGPGTLIIATRVHPGGLLCGTSSPSVTVSATAVVSGTSTIVATDSQTVGTSLTIDIPDDGECVHYVDINGTGPWGDAGYIWTPLSTFEACTPMPGQPILPESFAGDGATDTFTLAWPYMPGSLVVLVEGVDWSDQVIEDDPTAGDFSLAYPPPLQTDPEPNVEVHYRYPKP